MSERPTGTGGTAGLLRAVLCLEDIGWGGTDKHGALRPGQSPRPWVARLTGYQQEEWQVFGRFERLFLRGQRDFSHTNRSGSRGIFLYYALKPGLYEVNERTSWTNTRRYYCVVADDTTITEVTREEAIAWLTQQHCQAGDQASQASADSASAS